MKRASVFTFLLRSRRGQIGLALILLFLFVALFGRWLAPHDPNKMGVELPLLGPSWSHPFGIDQLGRDVLSRVMTSAAPMLRISAFSVALGLLVGGGLGLAAGYAGRLIDSILMRALDIVMAFPLLLIAIAIVAFFGVGERNVILALALGFVPSFARVTRAATISVGNQPFVMAARAIGDGALSISIRQILPNILPVMLVQASLACAFAILGESALSFLSLSVQPPDASWGRMLAEGRDFLNTSPHLAVVPGATITLVVVGFNLIGDGLRDFLDPTLRDEVRAP